MKTYRGPGKYVAICYDNNLNMHYTKVFTIPRHELGEEDNVSRWILNKVDRATNLEAVYPLSIFGNLIHCYPIV